MIVRIVRLSFKPGHVEEFIQKFEEIKHIIESQTGCQHLQLLHDHHDENAFFTFSIWDRPEYLEKYRKSGFFDEIWSTVKQWFADRPVAFSLDPVDAADFERMVGGH